MGDVKRRKALGLYPEKSKIARLPVARSLFDGLEGGAVLEAPAILRSLPDKSWFRKRSAMRQLTTRSLSESEIETLFLGFPWDEYLFSCLTCNVKGESLVLVLGQLVASTLDVGQITDQAVAFAMNNCLLSFKVLGKQTGII